MNITIENTISLPINKNPLAGEYSKLVTNLFDGHAKRLNTEISLQDKQGRTKTDGGYNCIHLSTNIFLEYTEKMLESEGIDYSKLDIYSTCDKDRPKFIDIGCGVGQKVFIANSLFKLKAFGLELRQPFIDCAKKMIQELDYTFDPDRIFQANALIYTEYDKYDIIYFYCPLHDPKLELELEKRIANLAKRGAIVMPFLSCFFTSYSDDLKKLGWKYFPFNNTRYSGPNGYYKRIKKP